MNAPVSEFDGIIEPVIRRILEAPRDACVEMLTEEFGRGLTYRQALTALFIAANRSPEAHHEVYVIYAIDQMSLDTIGRERLVPIFWGLDSFKRQQERYTKQHRLDLKGELSSGPKTLEEFREAMESWDQERAEGAIIGLSRSYGPRVTLEELWHYGVREWGFIGHKIIAVANCWRSLQTVGWRYAEPMLRFLVADLLTRVEDFENQPFATNLERAQNGIASTEADWARQGGDTTATIELLSAMRAGLVDEASDTAFRQIIESKVPAGAIWDAVFLSAAELMYCHQNGGYADKHGLNTRPLHSNTIANAMHYAFSDTSSPRTRFLILLQAVAWITEFIRKENARGNLRDLNITDLSEEDLPDDAAGAADTILSGIPTRELKQEIPNRSSHDLASRQAFAYGRKGLELDYFTRKARQLICRKANPDAHDYKFPVAIFQNYGTISPEWRDHLLATSVQWLHGDRKPDSSVFQRLSQTKLFRE